MDAPLAAIIVTLARSLGLLALVTLAYGGLARRIRTPARRALAIGLLFGGGASLAMLDPQHVSPGVIVDARSVVIALAAPFGGWPAAVVAGLLAAATRLWLGGAGAVAGILGIALTAAGGIALTRLLPPDGNAVIRTPRLLLLGVAAAMSMLGLLVLPAPVMIAAFAQAGLPLLVTDIAGTLALGTLLSREAARNLRERKAGEAARTDALTGIANRRAFSEEAQRVHSQAERYGIGYSVLLLDCDRFKGVNDGHGHAAGDRVLARLAQIMAETVRETDLVARYGGEEFAALLPATGTDGTLNLAERLRHRIAEERIPAGDDTIRVTASIGVSAWHPGAGGLDGVIRAADEALYEAKRTGRDRIVCRLPGREADGPVPFAAE